MQAKYISASCLWYRYKHYTPFCNQISLFLITMAISILFLFCFSYFRSKRDHHWWNILLVNRPFRPTYWYLQRSWLSNAMHWLLERKSEVLPHHLWSAWCLYQISMLGKENIQICKSLYSMLILLGWAIYHSFCNICYFVSGVSTCWFEQNVDVNVGRALLRSESGCGQQRLQTWRCRKSWDGWERERM